MLLAGKTARDFNKERMMQLVQQVDSDKSDNSSRKHEGFMDEHSKLQTAFDNARNRNENYVDTQKDSKDSANDIDISEYQHLLIDTPHNEKIGKLHSTHHIVDSHIVRQHGRISQ